jgi:septin family protein
MWAPTKHIQISLVRRRLWSNSLAFRRAVKHGVKLRLAVCGPSGSGKTYTLLTLATELGRPIAVVDTERGSASKYADIFKFDVLELDTSFRRQHQYIQRNRLRTQQALKNMQPSNESGPRPLLTSCDSFYWIVLQRLRS